MIVGTVTGWSLIIREMGPDTPRRLENDAAGAAVCFKIISFVIEAQGLVGGLMAIEQVFGALRVIGVPS